MKMMLKKIMDSKWKKISVVLVGMAGIAVLNFNCGPSLFKAANFSSTGGPGASGVAIDIFDAPKTSPYALMNTYQVFASYANLTGQELEITAAQRAEYDARTGALSQTDKISDVNAPLQMAATSLAGEFCNGLIAKESAAGAERRFFTNVNFGANLSSNSADTYRAVIQTMAQNFWGRDLKPEESSILEAYYNDFVSTAGNQAAQTRALYLATCAAMLSSFDTITY